MTKYSHSSLCHAMLFCNQNMVVLLIHLALTKYYCCSNETMCWHFDKKAQEQIFEDNPVWFEISGMGVMGRFTRPLPLPAPLELPAPYPILPLPDWGLRKGHTFATRMGDIEKVSLCSPVEGCGLCINSLEVHWSAWVPEFPAPRLALISTVLRIW